ncbi:MAG: hypothetical protein K0S48_490 [Ramlibacter sp.]|nr:hypothetical protein [Ramlibacter sp.]
MGAAARRPRPAAEDRRRERFPARRLAGPAHRLGAGRTAAGGRRRPAGLAAARAAQSHAAAGAGATGAGAGDRHAPRFARAAAAAREPVAAMARVRRCAGGRAHRIPRPHRRRRDPAVGAVRLRRRPPPGGAAHAAVRRWRLPGRGHAAGVAAADAGCEAGGPLPGAGAGQRCEGAAGLPAAGQRPREVHRRAGAVAGGEGGRQRAAPGHRDGPHHAVRQDAGARSRGGLPPAGPGAVLARGSAHPVVGQRADRPGRRAELAPRGRRRQCGRRPLGCAAAAGHGRAGRGRVARRHGPGQVPAGAGRRGDGQRQWPLGRGWLAIRGPHRRCRSGAGASQPGALAVERAGQAGRRRPRGGVRRQRGGGRAAQVRPARCAGGGRRRAGTARCAGTRQVVG